MKNFNKIYSHALAILGFVVVSLIYFYPVLQGKKIFQSDIAQFTGMAKEQNDFRKETGEEPYWTNSAFGGMPTYQLGANYPHNYIKELDSIIRFLPRPADYLFLYFLGFFILLRVLKADVGKAFVGALAFGFSTYLIIILGVGHNAKAHAIAYMPIVVAGVIMVFQKRYIAGGLLTMAAAALEINANHFQMTFYLLILLLVIAIYFIAGIIKSKDFRHLGLSSVIFVTAGILAIGANATNLMATSEYAGYSTRSDSELTFEPDGTPKKSSNAMSYEYITEYSYGIAESLNLIAPRLFGGANNEKLSEDSHMVEYLQSQQIAEGQYISKQQAVEIAQGGMPTYWGDQPIVAAPAYIGAVVFFLFVLALFAEKRKIKYALLAGALLSLMLSWGKNFPLLTDLFINYFPLYNKFRAVSSIQVILELCVPALAIMGLYSFFIAEKEKQWDHLWKSAACSLGLIVLLFLCKSMFSFAGGSDAMYIENYGTEFINALKADRKDLYSADLLRSFVLILLAALALWLYTKQKMARNVAVVITGILMVSDLYFVDRRYVNADDFKNAREVDMPFEPTIADQQILQDKSHYRVFEVEGNMSSARASYFHKSIGGYHAAKPRKIQQLFDYQIARNNIGVLNMLNVKYVIQNTENGENIPTVNPDANGPAWFVSNIKPVGTADEEMKALNKLDTKKTAVINTNKFGRQFKNKTAFTVDTTATIKLEAYEPNYLKYVSDNKHDGLAVFSEVYYADGWKATIDGKPAGIIEANYVLRALKVPAGRHTIEFKFEPQVVKTGSTIALISTIGMLLLLGAGIYLERKKTASATVKQ
ncbi:hypothetical protein CHU92_10225 [Flavobacterium cyanobacteriorum]|uniref:Membrane protein YfhO n=1 Tax=Flavobacterium cyanobacteriorum TaxID=2022802 RepID=A0A255Z3S3_9FLAO|nr:YfhO family protein [Flavobacterium cyanobacteriorum]OYQ36092.1 hypothetical protein CHU92_10225 [Flavobacterium cyanobacteriorum]